jgi:CRP-like cAMP-binding protein
MNTPITFDIFNHEPDIRSLPAGTIVFDLGQTGDVMYAVIAGQVEIRRGGKTLASINPGQIFGEMAIIDQKPRSAQAIVTVDCKVAVISGMRIMRLFQINPYFAVQMMQNLCEKLRGNIES